MTNTENRSIILCYNKHSGTYDANFGILLALDKMIPELQKKGFVTVDNLLATENYVIQDKNSCYFYYPEVEMWI